MNKRNTVLSLEPELVDLAKVFSMNLSAIASKAIRKKLSDFRKYHFIPKIKKLKLKNMQPLKEIGIDFKQGTNIIIGANATGKTLVIKSILYALGRDVPLVQENGNIQLELASPIISQNVSKAPFKHNMKEEYSSGQNNVLLLKAMLDQVDDGSALLLDDFLDRLDERHINQISSLLKNTNKQVIMTTRSENILNKINAHEIRLSPKMSSIGELRDKLIQNIKYFAEDFYETKIDYRFKKKNAQGKSKIFCVFKVFSNHINIYLRTGTEEMLKILESKTDLELSYKKNYYKDPTVLWHMIKLENEEDLDEAVKVIKKLYDMFEV